MATCTDLNNIDHNLERGNTREAELEELARRQGAEHSPWAWAN
jgi:hypothetical protein